MVDLTAAESHFAFGENWKSFVAVVDETRVAGAIDGVRKLFPDGLAGAHVLDIGCGSGLSALAMLRLGAARVDCVDIDPNSVEATRTLLKDAPGWTARVESVFDLEGQYDVVHSWGVLHHTGDMWRAIDRAASLVKPGGRLALALYGKTRFCGFWKAEKAFYAQAPRWVQATIAAPYTVLHALRGALAGRNPFTVHRARLRRGMSFRHDVHDWLGGHPYESATPEEVRAFLAARGFTRTVCLAEPRVGVLGTGCDEYVFVREA